MKKTVLGTVSALALGLVSTANAADMPVKARTVVAPVMMFNWTGCYVGGHVGYGWSKIHGQDYSSSYNYDYNGRGGLYGGQVGCNYQAAGNPWVLGLEGAYSGASIKGHSQNAQGTDVSNKISSLGSITGQIGYAGFNPQVLLYVKGGWAWADQDVFIATNTPTTTSVNRTGWTAGVGVAWVLAPSLPNWSAFLEYDHYHFGLKDHPFGIATEAQSKAHVDTIKLGLNYKFDFGKAPLSAKY